MNGNIKPRNMSLVAVVLLALFGVADVLLGTNLLNSLTNIAFVICAVAFLVSVFYICLEAAYRVVDKWSWLKLVVCGFAGVAIVFASAYLGITETFGEPTFFVLTAAAGAILFMVSIISVRLRISD